MEITIAWALGAHSGSWVPFPLIREETQRKNKLTAICDELFPELTQVLKKNNLSTALTIRERFPTPHMLATASFSALQEARGQMRQLFGQGFLVYPKRVKKKSFLATLRKTQNTPKKARNDLGCTLPYLTK
ncbi:hypothetical protein [Ktedonobacter sp. SOSP1-52]|uniref:hypothetical protein n=1 Tax=Ktedonobacter sp. SOSP1-52 TaxID=2778366 RepID=UPI001F2CD2B5|nr:hypothetical protein [Ktedonobacter sp. SOSP1-52]